MKEGKPKKKPSFLMWIIIGLGAIIFAYFIFVAVSSLINRIKPKNEPEAVVCYADDVSADSEETAPVESEETAPIESIDEEPPVEVTDETLGEETEGDPADPSEEVESKDFVDNSGESEELADNSGENSEEDLSDETEKTNPDKIVGAEWAVSDRMKGFWVSENGDYFNFYEDGDYYIDYFYKRESGNFNSYRIGEVFRTSADRKTISFTADGVFPNREYSFEMANDAQSFKYGTRAFYRTNITEGINSEYLYQLGNIYVNVYRLKKEGLRFPDYDPEDNFTVNAYAVADLDFDGTLELIITAYNEDTHESFSGVYHAFDRYTLDEVFSAYLQEGDAVPDFYAADSWKFVSDGNYNQYFLLEDSTITSSTVNSNTLCKVFIRGDSVQVEALCSEEHYTEDGQQVDIYKIDGNEVDKDIYDKTISNQNYVVNINRKLVWSTDYTKKGLFESYKAFCESNSEDEEGAEGAETEDTTNEQP